MPFFSIAEIDVRQLALAVLVLAAGSMPTSWASGWPSRILGSLRTQGLNSGESQRIELGYYEGLRNADSSSPVSRAAEIQPFDAGVLATVVADAREFVLKPNYSTLLKGKRWTTDEYGRRDRPRSLKKAPGSVRYALVGDSIGAGWGVDDDQDFSRVWEASLISKGRSAEVLNFAVPGHAPGQRWEHFHRIGLRFAPDVVLFEGTAADALWDERRVRAFVSRGLGGDSHVYGEFLRSIQLDPGESLESAKAKLKPHRERLPSIVYRAVVDDCRALSIPCVWLLLPRVGKSSTLDEIRKLRTLAEHAGFRYFIDLSDAFDGIDPAGLAIAADDFHPNALGHALLAERIEQAIDRLELGEAVPNAPDQVPSSPPEA